MKEIFNDPSRSEDAIKCATKDEVQELMSDYSLTSKQITSEFRKMYKAEWIRKRRIISKKVNPTKTSPPIYSGLGYPFENCSFKRTNIPDRAKGCTHNCHDVLQATLFQTCTFAG
jgi:hypothetical protein